MSFSEAATAFGDPLSITIPDNVIALDPDVAEVFSDAKAVNEALRLLARSAGESQRSP